MSTFILRNSVLNYNLSVQTADEQKHLLGTKQDRYPVTHFAIDFGPSNLLGKSSNGGQEADHNNALRWGVCGGGELIFYPFHHFGLGIKSRYFSSSSTTESYQTYNFSNSANPVVYGTLKTQISTVYVGFDLSFRNLIERHTHAFYINTSLGPVFYSQEDTYMSNLRYVSTQGIGSSADLGYDIDLNDNVALGLQLSLSSSVFSYKQAYVASNNANQYIVHLRVDLTVGIRFNSTD